MYNQRNMVVLVDRNDREIGIEDKLKAHQKGGKLHRAITIFIFNRKGETLLQQRAMTKYHTPGKWSNTCCSHPMPNKSVVAAAHRRLMEEMGFDCKIDEAFAFTYIADVGNGLTENEYDHVFLGSYDGNPKPNKDEVMSFRWISLDKLKDEIDRDQGSFTPWLKIVIDRVIAYRKNNL
jgi:isopentenyl-diphosphate delta-isomerase